MNKLHDQKDYLQFMTSTAIQAPRGLRDATKQKILSKLNINPLLLWGKITMIHICLASLALISCPQFEIELSQFHSPLLHFFHQFDPWWCSLLCGAYFFLLGSLFIHFFLRKDELQIVAQLQHFFHLLMLAMSLSFFAIFGQGVFELMTIFWAIGGFCSLWGFFNIGLLVRQRT